MWLSPEYKDILANREMITAEFKERKSSLEYYFGIVSDLFVDWSKMKGRDTVHRIPEIRQALQANDLDILLAFFENEASTID